jgi:hypothetical protein
MSNVANVPVAPGTLTFRSREGNTVVAEHWLQDRLYTAVQLNNGEATEIQGFSAGRSQQIPGGTRLLSRSCTNLTKPGSTGLDRSWEMLVFSFGFHPLRAMRVNSSSVVTLDDLSGALSDPVSPTSWFNVSRATAVEFMYRGKPQVTGRMEHFQPGYGMNPTTTLSDQAFVTNGFPSPADRQSITIPVHIAEGIGFSMDIKPQIAHVIAQSASDGGNNLTRMDVEISMYGLVNRPVS